MTLTRKAVRVMIVLVISLLLIEVVAPLPALAQTTQPAAASSEVQKIIEAAEALFQQGRQAFEKGELEAARQAFDQALDTVMMSGLDPRKYPQLEKYGKELVNRIHKFESKAPVEPAAKTETAEQKPPIEERPEVVEKAVIDDLSKLDESTLAAVTPEGIRIYGTYDFDFSVAPPVLQYLNYFAVGSGRSTMEVGLRRSGRYREMAERIFKEERVPLDLIWLAQAESVWKPNALSHAAAKGIWQFIPGTGSRYGLSQTGWVDQRSHPELSTRAAARYLRFLHDYFAGDWMLAMAAYNSGEGRVESSIAKCGYADFWELHRRGLLPSETRNYVPIILAIMIISKNQKLYGFDVKPDHTLVYDTYEIPDQTDLKVVADLLGTPYESVQELNPELRRGVTPPGQSYTLKIPKGMKKQFEIAYAELPEDQRVRKIESPRDESVEPRRSYRSAYTTRVASLRVGRGDTLSSLARRYGVSVQELARLNRLSARGSLRKGQTIRVPVQARAGRLQGSKSKIKSGRYASKSVVRSRTGGRNVKSGSRSKGKAPAARSSARRRR